jgi:tryptophan synthase beta subunit
LPDAVIACVGGGSNAIGLFADFLDDDVRLIGVEAAGKGSTAASMARPCCAAGPGILHGAETYVLQDEDGQIATPGRSRPASIIPRSGPSMPSQGQRPRRICRRHRRRGARAFALLARSKGSSARSNPPMRSRTR